MAQVVTTGGRRRPLVIAWAIAVACSALGTRAGAECRVTPGPEGAVATWLVAGPVARPVPPRGATVDSLLASWIDESRATALQPLRVEGSVRATRGWHALASADDRLRIDTNGLARGAREGWLAIELRVSAARHLMMFAGADDGFAVFLDGHEITRRTGVHDALDDDELVPLDLTAGTHTLAIAQHVNGGALRFEARFVGEDFRPARDVVFALPGVDDAGCDQLARDAVSIERPVRVTANGFEIGASIEYPGGTAHRDGETSRHVAIVDPADGRSLASHDIALDGAYVEITGLQADRDDAHPTARLDIAGAEGRALDVHVADAVRRALRHAAAVLARFDEAAPPTWLPLPSLTSAEYLAERLARLVRDRDEDASHLLDEANSLEDIVRALETSRDPYPARRGALRRGYRSDVDGSLQGYSVYVPPSYRGDRAFPVIVALHGLGGTAHRMLPVLFGLYDEHESREHADRHLPPLPDAQAIIVAPYGFGDAGYRALGETDVMTVLDEVRRAYRIDSTRTYMTGLSMGGIGAASIPLHRPDVFAAAAPLCGYHSYFVRHDTDGERQPWETFLMEARSNALWAENGLHLPLYVVHGTLDRPVANSRVLVDRYTELHYDVSSEWPELGHNVWSTTYADGRIVPRFLRFRRDEAPRHVRFRTVSTRWGRSDWVAVDGLASRDAWADVDATVSGSELRVTTHGARALTFAPPAALFSATGGEITARIDGDTLAFRAGESLSCERGADSHWHTATRHTDPPLGPIRDVFDGPVAVVYGTQDTNETAMNVRVARAWARVKAGVHAHVPVVADSDLSPELVRSHTLVIVGTPRSNSYLARIQSQLPMRIEGDTLRHGARTYRGAQVGAVFVAANPDATDRAVLVVTGTSALGVWRSRFLPDLVPDYVVFDEHIAAARGRIILGSHARVLSAGFWTAADSANASSAPPTPHAAEH